MANDKFHHEGFYRGKDYKEKLAKHHITICGAGALGSNLVDNLTRTGFINLKVIDRDRVDTHNLNTQVYSENDIGALKADALKNKVFRNVGAEIEAINKELTPSNAKALLKNSTLVLDCFDNNAARTIVQTEVRARKIPCLHCGMHGEGYGEIIWDEFYRVPKDQTEGDDCDYPLARNLACFVVSIAAEEIIDFCLSNKSRMKNWSFTLKDLKIGELSLPKI